MRRPKLRARMEQLRPTHVAFLGKPAYSAIVGRRMLEWGEQPERFGSSIAWVLPNPSGRNRAFSLEALVTSYRLLRSAMHESSPALLTTERRA